MFFKFIGEIEASVVGSVIKDLVDDLVVGTAIVLQNVRRNHNNL